MADLLEQLTDEMKNQFEGVIDDLDTNVKPRVKTALRDAALAFQLGITTGNMERANRTVQFHLSTVASLASISASKVEAQAKVAFNTVMSSLVDAALKAI